MPKSNITGLKDALIAHKSATIIVHHNADPDAIGSAIALSRGLAQLGVSSEVCAPFGISAQSKSILAKYPFPVSESQKIEFKDLVFLADTSTPEQIGNIKIPESSELVVIDHHEPGAFFAAAKYRFAEKESHATAFIVFDLFKNLGVKITSEIAFFLLAGIVADTAFLRMVNSRDLKTAAELLEIIGDDIDMVYSAISMPEDISERIAKFKSFKRMNAYRLGDTIVAFSHAGSFESQAALAFVKSGADIAFVENIDEKKPEYRISGRLRTHLVGKIDLSKLMKCIESMIHGSAGGHPSAASANGKNTKNGKKVEDALLQALEKELGAKRKQIA